PSYWTVRRMRRSGRIGSAIGSMACRAWGGNQCNGANRRKDDWPRCQKGETGERPGSGGVAGLMSGLDAARGLDDLAGAEARGADGRKLRRTFDQDANFL